MPEYPDEIGELNVTNITASTGEVPQGPSSPTFLIKDREGAEGDRSLVFGTFLGTTNPSKLNAVRHSISEQFPPSEYATFVVGNEVGSGVSDNPMGLVEAVLGCLNRADNLREIIPDILTAEQTPALVKNTELARGIASVEVGGIQSGVIPTRVPYDSVVILRMRGRLGQSDVAVDNDNPGNNSIRLPQDVSIISLNPETQEETPLTLGQSPFASEELTIGVEGAGIEYPDRAIGVMYDPKTNTTYIGISRGVGFDPEDVLRTKELNDRGGTHRVAEIMRDRLAREGRLQKVRVGNEDKYYYTLGNGDGATRYEFDVQDPQAYLNQQFPREQQIREMTDALFAEIKKTLEQQPELAIRSIEPGSEVEVLTTQPVKVVGMAKAFEGLLIDRGFFYDPVPQAYTTRAVVRREDGSEVTENGSVISDIVTGLPHVDGSLEERVVTVTSVSSHEASGSEPEQKQSLKEAIESAKIRLDARKRELRELGISPTAKRRYLVAPVYGEEPLTISFLGVVVPDFPCVLIEDLLTGKYGLGFSAASMGPNYGFDAMRASRATGNQQTATSQYTHNRYRPSNATTGNAIDETDMVRLATDKAYYCLFSAQERGPVNYPSLFMSLATADEAIVSSLYNALIINQVSNIWMQPDPSDPGRRPVTLTPGIPWEQQIAEAIAAQDRLIVVLSENSIRSDVVRQEVELAESLGKPIIPIAIDTAFRTRRDLPPWVQRIKRNLQIAYFPSDESDPMYQMNMTASLGALLDALRREPERPRSSL